ncbi:hypothetical protein HDU76_013723, partial [Blyttiomyces sp. JEL0837]
MTNIERYLQLGQTRKAENELGNASIDLVIAQITVVMEYLYPVEKNPVSGPGSGPRSGPETRFPGSTR